MTTNIHCRSTECKYNNNEIRDVTGLCALPDIVISEDQKCFQFKDKHIPEPTWDDLKKQCDSAIRKMDRILSCREADERKKDHEDQLDAFLIYTQKIQGARK